MPISENDRPEGPVVKIEYEISSRAHGIYDNASEPYVAGRFDEAMSELASKFKGIVPCPAGENAARFQITGERGTGEGIFPEVKKHLFRMGYETTEIIKVPGLTASDMIMMEIEATLRGNTIMPIAIDPKDGYLEIRERRMFAEV